MTNMRKIIPATVITGFLGAGKTTLLRTVLANPGDQKIGVLVNDFGEINIDSALIVEGTSESISLSNGCVCCTIQTELVTAVRNLVESRPDLDRIIIEASGVSKSLPLADTIVSEELESFVSLDGMFCLVDAESFPELDYVTTELAIDQITGADLIILNKIDLISPKEEELLRSQLSGLMPHLRIVPASFGNVPLDILFGPIREGLLATEHEHAAGHKHAQVSAHTHHEHIHGPNCGCDVDQKTDRHTDVFASWSWHSDLLLDEAKLRPALRQLSIGLLRAKGILRVRRANCTEALYEFQQVGKRSRLTPLENASVKSSLIMAIGLHGHVEEAKLRGALDGCVLRDAT